MDSTLSLPTLVITLKDGTVIYKEPRELKFNPDQPRDKDGQWTDGGPASSGGLGKIGARYIIPGRDEAGFPLEHSKLEFDPTYITWSSKRTEGTPEQRRKLFEIYESLDKALSDPEIGQELWNTLSSITPKGLKAELEAMRTDGPTRQDKKMYGGRALPPPVRFVAGAEKDEKLQDAINKIAALLSDPELGQVVEAMLEAALKTGNWEIFKEQVDAKFKALGGPGSGNHGHEGRPGQVGGSSSEESKVALDLSDAKAASQTVGALMAEAKVAHTAFEKETGVPDKDWAGWYGKFVSDKLADTTPEQMTTLISEAAAVHTGADWPQKYGEYVVDALKKPRALSAIRLAVAKAKIRKGLVAEPKTLGGPGSGNFGHGGRPGQVGGSSTDGWKSPGGWEHTGITWKQETNPKTGRPIPIKVKTVEEGCSLVLQGKVVEVETTEQAYTLIHQLAADAIAAKSAGEAAKDFDLCNVTVKGTNLFCAESLRTAEYPEGIPRLFMPQLGGKPVPGSEADKLPRTPWDPTEVDGAAAFKTYLQGIGMKTTDEVVPASGLRASQREMKGVTVGKMMLDYEAKEFDPAKNPIFISKDNYVVDGHHRWAAVVGIDSQDNRLGTSTMNVVRVNAPISEVLHIANTWSQRFGIAQNAGVKKQGAKTGLQKS